jgi:hypothetical protein
MFDYLTLAATAAISFIFGALGLLFISKKGADLLNAIKISDTINKLNRQINLKDDKIDLLEEQNTLLAKENKSLRAQNVIFKKDHELLKAVICEQSEKIEGMEFIIKENQKSMKFLMDADRDFDEWRDTVFEALNQFTDLPPSMIEKLTGGKKIDKPKIL